MKGKEEISEIIKKSLLEGDRKELKRMVREIEKALEKRAVRLFLSID